MIVCATAPLVDSPDGFVAQFVLKEVLGGVDLESDAEVDFTGLGIYGGRCKPGEFSPRLIDMMYRQSPFKAIGALASIMRAGDALAEQMSFANHAVEDARFRHAWNRLTPESHDDAVAKMNGLLDSDQWWVRRYVAEIEFRYEYLRDGQLMNRLRTDPDPHIREALARHKEPETHYQ